MNLAAEIAIRAARLADAAREYAELDRAAYVDAKAGRAVDFRRLNEARKAFETTQQELKGLL